MHIQYINNPYTMRLYIIVLLLFISIRLFAQDSIIANRLDTSSEKEIIMGIDWSLTIPLEYSSDLYGLILNGNDCRKLLDSIDIKWYKVKTLKIIDNIAYSRIQLRSLVVFNDTILKSDKDRYRVLSKTTKDKVKMHFLDKEDAMLIYGKKGKYGALIIKSIDD